MMDFLGTSAGAVTAISVIGAATVATVAWLRKPGRQLYRKIGGALDVLVGRDAITDRATGRELAPPMLGIGQRMDVSEQNHANLREDVARVVGAVESLVERNERLDDHDRRLKVVEAKLGIEADSAVVVAVIPPAAASQ